MKKLLFIIALFVSFATSAQTYIPPEHTVSNKSYGMAQAGPTDARTYFFDANNFVYRPYQSTAEVLTYLGLPKYRTGQFDIVVNTGGTLNPDGTLTGGTNAIWYFKNGQADGDLVLKGSAAQRFGVEDNAATADRSFTWGTFGLTNTFDNIAGTSGWKLTSTSTAAANNLQRLLDIQLTGANATSAQRTTAIYAYNNHSGTFANNNAVIAEIDNTTSSAASAVRALGHNAQAIWAQSATPFNGSPVVNIQQDSTGNALNVALPNSLTTNAGAYAINAGGGSSLGAAARFSSGYQKGDTIMSVVSIWHNSNPAGVLPGMGVRQDFKLSSTTTSEVISNALVSRWTTATHASRVSAFDIKGVNNGTEQTLVTFSGDGTITETGYGSGTKTGTLARLAGWTSAGVRIEVDPATIGTTWGGKFSAVGSFAGPSTLTTTPAIQYTGTGGHTLTLPSLSGNSAQSIRIKNAGSGNVTIATAGGGDVIYTSSSVSSVVLTPGQSMELVAMNSTTWQAYFITPTSFDASVITSGTLTDARLSNNVPLKNTPNTFTADNTFNASINLPATTATVGIINAEGVRFIHNYTDPDVDLQADTRNVFVGYEAGNFTMGPGASPGVLGGRNVGIGYRSLKANTTGWQNTAVGHISQQKTTSGIYNTSLGAYSLAENTTGQNNTALGSDAMWQNTTGNDNTGVGTYVLQQNTTGASNVAVGMKAMMQNTTGSNNVAVGQEALYLHTATSNSVAIGYQSQKNSTSSGSNTSVGAFSMTAPSGSSNSAFGAFALQSITTATQNAVSGYNSGSSITSGGNNSLFGAQTGIGLTTGTDNVAVGTEALKSDATHNYNIAIGSQAMKNNNSIGQNVAIGAFSMFAVQGAENTAVGTFGMQSITTGTGNTAIGYGANSTATTGSSGIYIGSQSAWNQTTGARNVYIGYKSGYTSTTENDNVVIGYDQRLPALSEDGQLNIQNIIFGRGNTGNNATLSTGKIGIGVVDPQARLHTLSTTEQFRIGFDASNYVSYTVNSGGDLTVAPTGGDFNVTGNISSSTWGSGIATFLQTPSSANLATAVTDESGAAGSLMFSNGPTTTGQLTVATLSSNATTTSANFAIVSSNNVATTTNSGLIFGGASQIKARVWYSGSANGSLSTNDSYGGVIVGNTGGVTGASAGTHAAGASLVARGFTFTPNATTPAAMTKAATIWINEAPTGATTNYAMYINGGKVGFDATNTASGTTGAQTINKPTGTVNFAAAATSLVVTNNLVTTSSIVYCVIRTNDANATAIKSVVPASGSFTINLTTAPAAEVSVGFIVYN